MARKLSPVELLHPDGVAESSLVLGNACPPGLQPEHRDPQQCGSVDLIIVAPTRAEVRTRGWLQRSGRLVSEKLKDDGVAYVVSPRGWRARSLRALSARGLSLAASIAHLPDLSASRYLVPLAIEPSSYVFSSVVPIATWKRRLMLLALSSPQGQHLLARTLPAVGFAMQHAEARPLFDWLYGLDGVSASETPAVVTTSRLGAEGSFVVHRFSRGGRKPTAVVKLGPPLASGDGRFDEAEILRHLARGARRAGAIAPEPLAVSQRAGRPLMLQSPVPGRSAAVILAEAPRRLSEVWLRLIQWLERWNIESLDLQPLTATRLETEVVGPARRLAHLFDGGDRYADRLERRYSALVGEAVPFTTAHNDLTMANVFLDQTGQLGVVDWEAARRDNLPLVDFYYSVVDAAAAAGRYADHVQAFRECFTSGGAHAAAVGKLEGRLRRAVDLSPLAAELCFHACWLHHAANENRMSASAKGRPFLSILQRVANDAFP